MSRAIFGPTDVAGDGEVLCEPKWARNWKQWKQITLLKKLKVESRPEEII
jgi:hypothetical protein